MTANWKVQQLEECLEPVTYTTKVQRKELLDSGHYPVISQEEEFVSGYWNEAENLFRLDRPVVVFGDHTRVLKYVDFDFVLGADGVKVLKPKEFLNPRYFYYQLHTAHIASLGYARHYRLLKEHAVAYPDLGEQQRIVGILDEAFACIATAKANAEKNLQNARSLFDARRESLLADRSSSWIDTTLGDEIDLLVGFAFKSSGYVETDDSVRLLRGDNIVQGRIRWDEAKRWPNDDAAAYQRYALREGDVVLAMDRPWVKAGLKRAVIGAEDLPALLVQRTACLRARASLGNRYLFDLVSGSAFIQHLIGVQTGIGVPHISGQQIKDFEFARPPLDEQQRITKNLAALQMEVVRLESIYQRKLAALDELKKSLLHRAFSGQL
jgi:type I restriction enzyme S subunit